MDAEPIGPEQFQRLLDSVVSLTASLDLDQVLHKIVASATELAGARYGALGVLNPERTALSDFITVGLEDDQVAAIGNLPKGHGILGLLIVDPQPLRLPDLNVHPESYGFPPDHPPMNTFLGVPVLVGGEVYGNLYLTDKSGGESFTATDEALARGFAAAAGVAVETTRLHGRVRDLDVLADRERIARDLHDTVIQRLFAIGLSLQGTVRLVDDPELASRIQHAIGDLDLTISELRTSIFELQGESTSDGLRRQLLAIRDELTQILGFRADLRFEGPVDSAVPRKLVADVVAVVREALTNVSRHADAPSASVVVSVDDQLTIVVTDAGTGYHGPRPGGQGLTNLSQRATRAGGRLTIEAGPSGGTILTWSIPLREA